MQKKDCFLLGTIFKLHGYKGNVNIYNEHGVSFNPSNIKHLLIERESVLIPFFVERISRTKTNIILVKFEDVDSEIEANKILKSKVYIKKSWLPKEINDKVLEDVLIGYSVFDITLGDLGEISYINSQTPQKLIYVTNKNRKTFCFPMHEKFIKNINKETRIITSDIPEELINLD